MQVYKDLIYNPEAPGMCRLDAYIPEKVKGAYLYLHGGGMTHGDKCTGRTTPMYETLAEKGIAVFSANYRFLPVTDHDIAPRKTPVDLTENDVDFPVPVEDSALAFHWMMTEGRKYCSFDKAYIGGSSAGGYLSMMLCFDGKYLGKYGYDSLKDVKGYVFDAGQPTTHFHLLELRGESDLRVLVDEAAPLWYLSRSFASEGADTAALPELLFVTAERDMPGRVEQNALFIKTLKNFDYPEEKIRDIQMMDYGHCQYIADPKYIREVARLLSADGDVPC